MIDCYIYGRGSTLEKTVGNSSFSGAAILLGVEQQNMITELFNDPNVSVEILDTLMKDIGRGYGWNTSEIYGRHLPLASKEVFEACKDIFLRRKNSNASSVEEGSKK